MEHAEPALTSRPDPKPAPVPDALPTEGAQIALAWVVFGSLVVCAVGLIAVATTLIP